VRPSKPKSHEKPPQSECDAAGHDVALAIAVFMVEVHRSEIDRLVQHGLLRAAERDNEGAVVDALSHYIEQTLGSAL
jgi:hypothetical protein